MEDIKSKKRRRRLDKRKTKKVAIPEWIVHFKRIFHYFPLEGYQAFFEGYFQSCEASGYKKGKEDETKAYKELLDWVKPIFEEWQGEGYKNEISTIVGILEWKLQREYERGKLDADNPAKNDATLSLPKKSEELQTNIGGRSTPTRENRERISRGKRSKAINNKKDTKETKVE